LFKIQRNCWLVPLGMALLAGCGGDDPAGPGNGDPAGPGNGDPEEPLFHSAVVSKSPANEIGAEVHVLASGYDSARVRAWREGEAPELTPFVAFAVDTTLEMAVLGLYADSDYSLEVILVADGVQETVDTLAFATGSLPDWLPAVVPVGTDPAPGFVTLSVPGGPVIIDNTGRVVWYLTAPDPVLSNFQAHPDGSYTLLGRDTDVQEFRVLDELGRETGRLGCVGRDETRFHEVRVAPGGDYWIMCHDRRIADLTDLGGMEEVALDWTVVQHVSASGFLLWEWNSADHFSHSDIDPEIIAGASAINVTHGNAIAFDTDGNLLVSFRELFEITKIEAETGEVIWRFGGGQANQFTFVGDPKGSFERQHGLRVVAPAVIQLLDNSRQAPSRLVRYRIDEAEMTAELLFQFIDAEDTHTPVGGSTDVLEGGGALVSFGRAGRVAESSSTGERVWELTGIDGLYVFRAQRIPSLYAAERMQ